MLAAGLDVSAASVVVKSGAGAGAGAGAHNSTGMRPAKHKDAGNSSYSKHATAYDKKTSKRPGSKLRSHLNCLRLHLFFSFFALSLSFALFALHACVSRLSPLFRTCILLCVCVCVCVCVRENECVCVCERIRSV